MDKRPDRLSHDKYLISLAYVWSVWTIHSLLRFFWLARNDAYGFPLVSKIEWYIFHAVSIDFIWIIFCSLPLILTGAIYGTKHSRMYTFTFTIYIIFHSLVLLGTVVNQETYRFLGGHLSFNLLDTYGNDASIREVFNFVAQDLTWRYFPYFLFYGSVPCSILGYFILKKSLKNRFTNTIIIIICGAVFWVFPNIIWPGTFREKKLSPLVIQIYGQLKSKKNLSLSRQEVVDLSKFYHRHWTAEQGDSSWIFNSESALYYRTPIDLYCAENKDDSSRHCISDKDGDGYNSGEDCDDMRPDVHPGALEIPSNGLDDDCSGVDSLPWNFVLIFLESHRAVNAGFLRPYGASADGTPFLDSLAPLSHIWTRFNAAGLPTVSALMSSHLSILAHPKRYIATAYPLLKNKAFTVHMQEKGYRTHFFSSADPSWDNQTPWLRQWYQGYSYHRARENDADMFNHMSKWMLDSLSLEKSFCVTAITKTNHYPFNAVDGMKPHEPDDDLQTRMLKTMKYTEEALHNLLNNIKDAPWFSRTLFVIMADHGFSLGAHGKANIGWGLYTEHTWIPFLIYGSHPLLAEPRVHNAPADQRDIGPTLLALAGIRTSNHFMGHNLLRKNTDSLAWAMTLRKEQGLIEWETFRVHGPIGSESRIQGNEVFNAIDDRLEKYNVYEQNKLLFDSLNTIMKKTALLNTYLIEKNFLLD